MPLLAPGLPDWPCGRLRKGLSIGPPPPAGPGPPALTLTCPKKCLSASSCQLPVGCWGCQSLSSAELTRISSMAGTRTCSCSWPCAPAATACVESSLRVTPSCQEPAVRSCRQEIKEPSAFQSLSLGTGEGQGQGERDRERERQVSFAMKCCTLSTSLPPASTPAQPAPHQALGSPAHSTAGCPAQAAQNADAQRAQVSSLPRSLPTPQPHRLAARV